MGGGGEERGRDSLAIRGIISTRESEGNSPNLVIILYERRSNQTTAFLL